MNSRCKTILIIEDDDLIRDTLKATLEFEGFTVATAENGQRALELLSSLNRPCLILLDLMMPIMNGWEFLEYRKENDVFLTIPVAIVSAATDSAIQKAHGYQAIIKKPIDLDIMLAWVRKYCDQTKAEAK